MILEENKTIASLDLVIQLYRGFVYFLVHQLSHKEVNIDIFFLNEFGIGYNTDK
jgi:hypothetical protein